MWEFTFTKPAICSKNLCWGFLCSVVLYRRFVPSFFTLLFHSFPSFFNSCLGSVSVLALYLFCRFFANRNQKKVSFSLIFLGFFLVFSSVRENEIIYGSDVTQNMALGKIKRKSHSSRIERDRDRNIEREIEYVRRKSVKTHIADKL